MCVVKAGAEPACWRKGTACSGKPGLTGGFSAPRPTLVLPESPGVTFHVGSGNAKDTTRKPGRAGQTLTAPSELVASKPHVGSKGQSFCHPLLRRPLLEGTSGQYFILSSMPPETLGLSTQAALGPCTSPVPSTAMTWGSPRGCHQWWHLPGPPAHPSPPRAPQRHYPRGVKCPHELETRRTAAPK